MSVPTIEHDIQTAPAVLGYHHLALTVRDVAASEEWYSHVLGLVRAFVEPHDTETGYAVVMNRPGTSLFLGLEHHAEADRATFDERRTGLDHLAFRVGTREEVDTWVEHLDRLGVSHAPLHEATTPMPMALVVFRDLDGIQLEVMWSGE